MGKAGRRGVGDVEEKNKETANQVLDKLMDMNIYEVY